MNNKFQNIPNELGNLITQFCTDDDNFNLRQSGKIFGKYIFDFPRQSKFIVNQKSYNLYKRYKNLEIVAPIYISFINNINLNDVTDVKLKQNDVWSLLERKKNIPFNLEFPNVRTLDTFNWGYLDYEKFINIKKLTIEYDDELYYPNFPNLEHLVTYFDKYDFSSKELPRNWISIKILKSEYYVPNTYINLYHYTAPNGFLLPNELKNNITHLYYHDYIKLKSRKILPNLADFSNLKTFKITKTKSRRNFVPE